jgi:Stress up-regulated Nod 19
MENDFPRDITIIASQSNVFDDKFEPIDRAKGLYNHHNLFFDLSSTLPPILSCNGAPGFAGIPTNSFAGGAADDLSYAFTNKDATFKSGFYLPKAAPILQMIDVVNYSDKKQVIYTITELEYLSGKQEDYLQAVSIPLDYSMCSGRTGVYMTQPKNKKQFTSESRNTSIAMDGWLLNSFAHLHDGGVDMSVKINGREICRSEARYGGPGHEGKNAKGEAISIIHGATMCDEPVQVHKGDKLDIVASFDMEKHPA